MLEHPQVHSTTSQVVCDHAAACGERKPPCRHSEPHEKCPDCKNPCFCCGEASECVPVESEPKDPDHAAMWARLRREVRNLILKDMREIDPILVDRFMDFIEEAERGKGT